MACADKAHKVDGDGGSGVLSHASRSQHIDLGRPPAAAGSLRSQVPDLVLWPSAAARLLAVVAGWSTRAEHEVEGVRRLGSLGYQTGWAVGASTDDQRTGYAHEVASVTAP